MGSVYTIAFAAAIGAFSVISILVIFVASYVCSKKSTSSSNYNDHGHASHVSTDDDDDDSTVITISVGLDEATLSAYPKLSYALVKEENKAMDDIEGGGGSISLPSCCSICLAEYKDSDLLRLLPHCKHFFHVNCIDPWLKLHTSCPMCRNSPHRIPVVHGTDLPAVQLSPRATHRVFSDPWFVQLTR